MVNLDLTKELKDIYRSSAKKVKLVNVPEMGFLMVDGKGGPKTPRFTDAVETLCSLSYRLRLMVKQGRTAVTYKVMPLEGLWWGLEPLFNPVDQDSLHWTLMMMQPDFVTQELFFEAREELAVKKRLTVLNDVRLERYAEGLSAQTLYVGNLVEAGPTVSAISQFVHERGYVPCGKHHEIYLGDHRRTAVEKRRTIIRQPVKSKNRSIGSTLPQYP